MKRHSLGPNKHPMQGPHWNIKSSKLAIIITIIIYQDPNNLVGLYKNE